MTIKFYFTTSKNENEDYELPSLKTLSSTFIHSPESSKYDNKVCDCTPELGNIGNHLKHRKTSYDL